MFLNSFPCPLNVLTVFNGILTGPIYSYVTSLGHTNDAGILHNIWNTVVGAWTNSEIIMKIWSHLFFHEDGLQGEHLDS
jgi:hypothetical protein